MFPNELMDWYSPRMQRMVCIQDNTHVLLKHFRLVEGWGDRKDVCLQLEDRSAAAIKNISWSPDSNEAEESFLAITKGNQLEIWRITSLLSGHDELRCERVTLHINESKKTFQSISWNPKSCTPIFVVNDFIGAHLFQWMSMKNTFAYVRTIKSPVPNRLRFSLWNDSGDSILLSASGECQLVSWKSDTDFSTVPDIHTCISSDGDLPTFMERCGPLGIIHSYSKGQFIGVSDGTMEYPEDSNMLSGNSTRSLNDVLVSLNQNKQTIIASTQRQEAVFDSKNDEVIQVSFLNKAMEHNPLHILQTEAQIQHEKAQKARTFLPHLVFLRMSHQGEEIPKTLQVEHNIHIEKIVHPNLLIHFTIQHCMFIAVSGRATNVVLLFQCRSPTQDRSLSPLDAFTLPGNYRIRGLRHAEGNLVVMAVKKETTPSTFFSSAMDDMTAPRETFIFPIQTFIPSKFTSSELDRNPWTDVHNIMNHSKATAAAASAASVAEEEKSCLQLLLSRVESMENSFNARMDRMEQLLSSLHARFDTPDQFLSKDRSQAG